MESVSARIVGSLGGRRWGWTQSLGAGGLLLQSHDNTRLVVTNEHLEPLMELDIPASAGGPHAVSEDLSRVALSLRDEVRLVDSAGRTVGRFPHEPWEWSTGACAFDHGGGHLWATIPANGELHLVVLRLDDLQEVDRRGLESDGAGNPLHHPDRRTIGWSIGEGQDGSVYRWARLDEQRMDLRIVPSPSGDRVLIAIHPTGTQYLTTPYHGGPLQVHRFDDDEVVGAVDDPEHLHWDFVAGYLDPDRIIAAAVHEDGSEHLLTLNREPLEPVAEIAAEGSVNEWSSLAWVGNGSWVSIGEDAAEMWQLVN